MIKLKIEKKTMIDAAEEWVLVLEEVCEIGPLEIRIEASPDQDEDGKAKSRPFAQRSAAQIAEQAARYRC